MLALLALCLLAPPDAYARPDLLVEADALVRQLDAPPKRVLLDCRPLAEFEKGTVPGAAHLDADAWAKAFKQGGDAAGWTKRVAELGISADSEVVLFDDKKSLDAGRAWWILEYWGVANCKLVNGGWRAYTAAKGPVAPPDGRAPRPSGFVARPVAERFAREADVLAALKLDSASAPQIVDARSEKERCGEVAFNNPRLGSIPGSKHLEWADLIDPATHKFLPAPELAKRFKAAGIALDRPSIAHCQGGGRSSVMAFALELMGAAPVRNYYHSFGEYSADPAAPLDPPTKR